VTRLAIALIKLYQRYGRKLHNRKCIYTPTCSNYAIISLQKYGFLKGSRISWLRIKRCNGALFQGGHDEP